MVLKLVGTEPNPSRGCTRIFNMNIYIYCSSMLGPHQTPSRGYTPICK